MIFHYCPLNYALSQFLHCSISFRSKNMRQRFKTHTFFYICNLSEVDIFFPNSSLPIFAVVII